MLDITRFYTRSFDLDHLDLFWEVANYYDHQTIDELILAYDFYVWRSESPAGPFEQISGPLKDTYYFRDTSPALLHRWRKLFYKLRIVDKRTSEEKFSAVTAQLPEPDLIALEIMRQEDVLFREHVGRQCWLFPVRTFGAYCICYDRTLGKRTRSNCVTCYDTGYLGGHLSPISCYVQIDPSPKNDQNTPLGKQQIVNTSARLISFPPMKPDDILIEAENKRWRVVTVSSTQRLRAVVHQELTIHEIPLGDVKYKLPVNIADLTKLEPSAPRNFTNPMHPDGSNERQNILAVYGYRPRGSIR